MATLKDIARRTGLSMNTVSRALRGSGYVSAAAAAKVREAARELGYRPNRAARELRNACSREIAVIAESGDSLHIQKITAIQETAAAAGYATNIFFIADEFRHGRLPALLEAIRAEQPAGVILIGMSAGLTAAGRELAAEVPVALVPYDPVSELDCVSIDRRQGVADAVRYLHRQGRRRIAYLGSDGGGNKLRGYRDAIGELGLEELWLPAEEAPSPAVRPESRRIAAELAAMPRRPDAIQTSDVYAACLTVELPKAGLRVPEDIALVGFDNREFAVYTEPELTTVAQPNREVGGRVAELLLRRIAEPGAPAVQLKIPMQLAVRRSA